jgi:hypothetical protein
MSRSSESTAPIGRPRKPLPPGYPSDPAKIRTEKQALAFLQLKDNEDKVSRVCGGITRQAVVQWRQVPVGHVPALEKAFGIPRAVIRPDIYA